MLTEVQLYQIERPASVAAALTELLTAVNPASVTYSNMAIYNESFTIAGASSTITFDALITVLYVDTLGVPITVTKALTGETVLMSGDYEDVIGETTVMTMPSNVPGTNPVLTPTSITLDFDMTMTLNPLAKYVKMFVDEWQ